LGPGETNPALRRLAFLIRLLEISPPLRDGVRAAVGGLLEATDCVSAIADTGVDHDRGFVGELVRRVVTRVLPAPREAHELGPLLVRLFPSEAVAARLRGLPEPWFQRLTEAIGPGERSRQWPALAEGADVALAVVATRIEAVVFSHRLSPLLADASPVRSPFFGLATRLAARERDTRADHGAIATLRRELASMETQMERSGVTISRVHALEWSARALDRIEALLALRDAEPAARVAAARALLAQLVDTQLESRGVRRLAADTLRLLARRIVEGHGRAGEHYIARTRPEYALMWRAAIGGGVLTVVTSALKLKIATFGLAPLPDGFLSGLNYAVSFLIMLSFHLALATKQPSMTAATLANIVGTVAGPRRLDLLADQVAATVRTQLAAALGNVLSVSAGALLLDLGFHALTGQSWITAEKAEHVLHSFHPLLSGTAFYAALTGVILWASGLIGGWFENWATAHRLGEAIAQHPLGERLGRARFRAWGEAFANNASAWGGSVALGFLLGFTPALSKFAGLPLDVRHVTLSSGMLTFAASALAGEHFEWWALAWAIAGIALIFVLNLSVSFLLALSLALRAQGVPMTEALRLARKLLGRFLRSPWSFIGPPPAGASGTD
ncbi:MAG: hypothetical protein ABL977_13675, partial [Candidatus Eisenbacteria bacterium]